MRNHDLDAKGKDVGGSASDIDRLLPWAFTPISS